ncbi:molybdopterin-binding protein [Aetokthonos hydrillicola Thurmond2011]|jgi:molybdopterin-binding protein|uniref:Molybdopterin-binding protein n=1 Tax=Aetokthonos hydrillicola Thurmond2011 TaxID=2712845 RepID=A0AAP5MCK8_9CYAN|nr:molybdopterin-binding protein [Aetokthonos hydrillicola]MBO3461362.1 transporter [Aetokthonos hydrillicola CCALA 1050]MBW4589241.1 molybdopterin-binding protein [Aetokthonos hydrillicola CCALA 1050]MDR9900425.1 molybdopterin-binding protein [Aetokthonos hydrillicola Thurmond2011]
MEVSARNSLKGTVKHIVEGAVNTEVVLEIAPGVEVVAIITKSSAEKLGLKEGKQAYAVVKATDVMVAVD